MRVAQALKLYGEPWKDIFFDSAAVLTPAWVLAAPLVQNGKKLGTVLWLANCRCAGRRGAGAVGSRCSQADEHPAR